MCGPEPSRRAARITAASPERRSRGACSASVTAAGAAQAACSRRRGRGCWPTPTVRQATASIKCFEQNFEMSRLRAVLRSTARSGHQRAVPARVSREGRERRDAAAARCARGERRAAARREEARHAAARAGGGAERGAGRSGRDAAWGRSRCRLEESSEAARARQRGSHLAKLRPGHSHTATGLHVRSRSAAGGGAAGSGVAGSGAE